MAVDTAVVARLARSRFRSRFRLSATDRASAEAKGNDTIRSNARDFVAARLAPAEPRNDGKQTPMRGHPVFTAQHATATCCRGCLRTWHGIAPGRQLSEAEQEAVVDLIINWIDARLRLPGLPDARP
jgi:hypothetical protein